MVRSLGGLVVAGLLAGCTAVVAAGPPAYAVAEEPREVNIPPGHMPPPGACRVWFQGEPPGHQPPPGDCDALLRSAPSGAWVLYRPSEERRVVRIG